ncbi:MAG: DNA polymerase III subunit gamma/tau, partial [Bacteroidales bacterium]|nr:DNA polymerase III subunit gamma/tau [Bacteroidales bacterium]
TITEKGFEGSNFLAGLNEHLRNLSICKNSKTLPLLSLSDNIKQKYQEQAEKFTAKQLVDLLTLFTQYEYQYKNIPNKRLHVEVALLRACNINKVRQS